MIEFTGIDLEKMNLLTGSSRVNTHLQAKCGHQNFSERKAKPMKNYCVLTVLTVTFLQVSVFDAQAEDTNTLEIMKQLQRRIDELEQKVKVLEAGKPAESQATDAQAKQRIADLDQKVKILERNRELDNEALEAKLKEKDSLFKTPAWVTSI